MSRIAVLCLLPAMGLAACSGPAPEPPPQGKSSAPAKGAMAPVASPASQPVAAAADPALPPIGQGVKAATVADPAAPIAAKDAPPAQAKLGPDPLLVKLQVLLDRARFSPGSIDGRPGGDFTAALSAFQAAHQLPVTGAPDSAIYAALVKTDARPVATVWAWPSPCRARPSRSLGKARVAASA